VPIWTNSAPATPSRSRVTASLTARRSAASSPSVESLDQADAALGTEQLHRAYARGKALSFDQAIDLAREGVPPST
jgi:hypothetical protein